MTRLLAIVFCVPLAAELLDRFIAWAQKRWRVEVSRYGIHPRFRFMLWVRVINEYDEALSFTRIIIALPSYEWLPTDFGYGPCCWHRRELVRQGPRWNGDRGRCFRILPATWAVHLVPVGE